MGVAALAVSSRADAALRHNSAQPAGSLYLLSEDLLFMVSQYLTSAEVITLMLSCTRFWQSRTGPGVFGRTWQEMKLPVGKELSKITARFYVLRMLEYDGLLQEGSPSKYCCWGCMKAHERQSFSSTEFRKEVNLKAKEDCYPDEAICRSCVLAKRYIWFGACREMSFIQLRHAVAHPHTQPRDRGWLDLRDHANFLFPECSWFDCKSRRFEYMIPLAFPRHVYSFSAFRRHARAVNLPLCPHLRVGDWEVIRLCLQPLRAHLCKHCRTLVQIRILRNVCVYVSRRVGLLRSPTDPVWMAQSYRTRHQRLEARCSAFCDWYARQYEVNGFIAKFSKFKPRQIRRPFKGLATWSPERLPGLGPI